MEKNRKNILVIDDDGDLCELMEIILRKEGYEVQTVRDMKQFDNGNLPDLIILDVLVSSEDGRKICEQLKNNGDTRHIPILMYSAGANYEKDARKAGADEFIGKPFQIKELIEKIKKLEQQ